MFSRTKVTVDTFKKEEPARNLPVELARVQAKISAHERCLDYLTIPGASIKHIQNPWYTLAEFKAEEAEILELIKQKEERKQ